MGIDPSDLRRLFDEGVCLRPEERSAFFDQETAGNSELRQQLEALLAAHDQGVLFGVEDTDIELDDSGELSGASLFLAPGTRLGPYAVTGVVGRGGMGEVYRALDTRLDRTVAIKVLPHSLARDPLARQRLEREAKAAAALAHPNICTLLDIGRHESIDFLVMEHLEGETLAARLAQGPMGLDEALAIALQIAAALTAAHRAGIVHRDLKPGNVMVTEISVRLLDFGLASHIGLSPCDPATATVTDPLTGTGMILGTLPYMSPEQIEGRAVDARTDIFALGAVLYELVTGRRAFDASGQAALIDSILNDQPPSVTAIDRTLPPALDRVIRRAMAKDPRERWGSVEEMHAGLRALSLPRTSRPSTLVVMATLAAIVLVATTVLRPGARVRSPTVRAVHQLTHDRLLKDYFYTDGARIFFTAWKTGLADTLVFQVPISGGEPVQISTPFQNAFLLDVFPGGRELLISGGARSQLYAIPTAAGQPRRLGGIATGHAAISPDGGRIVYGVENELFVAASDGSGARRLLRAPGGVMIPRWHPDGHRVRYTVAEPSEFTLWETVADRGGAHRVVPAWTNGCCGAWTSDGRYFVFEAERDGEYGLWTLPDPRLWQWTGNRSAAPVKLTTGPLRYENVMPARDGRTIFALGSIPGTGDLSKFDRQSRQWVSTLTGLAARDISYSRDAQWIAFVSQQDATLWRSRRDGRERRQLTFPPASVSAPRWSPDGKWIAFASKIAGRLPTVSIVAAEGGLPREIARASRLHDATWSPDGKQLLVGDSTGLRLVTIETRRVSPLAESEHARSPRWSPDGRWIVALSDDGSLLLFEFASRRWADLQPGSNGYSSPNWTSDGTAVVVQHGSQIERLHVPDGARTLVASLEGIRLAIVGVSEAGVGLTPDDEPMVLRQAAPTRELYALDVEWP